MIVIGLYKKIVKTYLKIKIFIIILFNTNIASIAFTGYGSYTRTLFKSSPEFTTNGMLAKSWRRIKNNIFLYKSGTEGFSE